MLHAPEAITVLAVVEAIDGRESLFRCTEIRQRGPLAQAPEAYHLPCAVHVSMARAERAWRETLRGQTIADIIALYERSVEADQQRRAGQWVEEHMRLDPDTQAERRPQGSPPSFLCSSFDFISSPSVP